MNEPCFVLFDTLSQIFLLLAHKSNSPQKDMILSPDTLFWLCADQSVPLQLQQAFKFYILDWIYIRFIYLNIFF